MTGGLEHAVGCFQVVSYLAQDASCISVRLAETLTSLARPVVYLVQKPRISRERVGVGGVSFEWLDSSQVRKEWGCSSVG